MAVKQRKCVNKECKDDERERSEQRKQKMIKENAKTVALKEKMCQEKERLSQLHLITTSEELQKELLIIDEKNISASKKRNKKISVLKTQVQIRRKFLGQTVPILFTSNRKQRPLTTIVTELCDFINKSTVPSECLAFLKDPIALVGKQIKQRFQDEENSIVTWYHGRVIDYCTSKKVHCVVYEGDDNQYQYDI